MAGKFGRSALFQCFPSASVWNSELLEKGETILNCFSPSVPRVKNIYPAHEVYIVTFSSISKELWVMLLLPDTVACKSWFCLVCLSRYENNYQWFMEICRRLFPRRHGKVWRWGGRHCVHLYLFHFLVHSYHYFCEYFILSFSISTKISILLLFIYHC